MGGKRILVVDDEPSVGMLVTHVLRDAGFTVELAKTGADGVAKLGANAYDAAFIDLMMPDMGGEEVVRAAKRSQPGLKIVLMTAEVEHRIPFRQNVDLYLNKPFRIATLEATANRACGVETPAPLQAAI